MASLRQKRYNGWAGNVAKNIFFEELMKSVAVGENCFIKYILQYNSIKYNRFEANSCK